LLEPPAGIEPATY